MADFTARKLGNLTAQELKLVLAQMGETPDYQQLAEIEAQAQETIDLPVPPAELNQNRLYKNIVNFSRIVTQALSILQVAVIEGLLAPLMTIFLAYVEWDRVRIGIRQFDTLHAELLGAVAILAYIVMTIILAHYESRVEKKQQEVWTVRKGLGDILNFILGRETRYVQEIDQIRRINFIIRMLIVISASFGSLQGQFPTNEAVSFQTAIETIFKDFRLATGVIIMALLALSLLQGLHWSLFRVYEITVNLTGGIEVDGKSFLADYERVMVLRRQRGEEAVKMRMIAMILEQQRLLKSQTPEQLEPTNSSPQS